MTGIPAIGIGLLALCLGAEPAVKAKTNASEAKAAELKTFEAKVAELNGLSSKARKVLLSAQRDLTAGVLVPEFQISAGEDISFGTDSPDYSAAVIFGTDVTAQQAGALPHEKVGDYVLVVYDNRPKKQKVTVESTGTPKSKDYNGVEVRMMYRVK